MASGFFAILDDIGALMDDVALASKVATQKTAGILGDDLAVNAEKATGFMSSRELPVLWAITKGSLLNKLIIIPVVLLLSYFLPVAITYILIAGGLYLSYEGMEKIVEFLFHRGKVSHSKNALPAEIPESDPSVAGSKESAAESERSRIRAAIATDFILSLEIVIIALSTVLEKTEVVQIVTVAVVAVLATIGVYGIVAVIVRMDDAGYRLMAKSKKGGLLSVIGKGLVNALPVIIKILGVVGTIALLLVSGGIFIHKIGFVHFFLPGAPDLFRELLAGAAAGLVVLSIVAGLRKILPRGRVGKG